jgi:Xaa-Pro aminopeptidase
MKSDLDRLMRELNLDAIFVIADESPNPYNDYLTNRARAGGDIVKKRDQEAVLIVGGMEVAIAAKSGLKVYTVYDFGYAELLQQHPGDAASARRGLYRNILRQLGVAGRVAPYGVADVADTLRIFADLRVDVPEVEFVFDSQTAELFARLYETKDEREIAALQEAARLTSQVVCETRDFISQHHAEGNAPGSRVVNAQGEALTIGAVKRFIREREMALGLDDPEGCIFAQGRDSAFPHSVGEDGDVLQVGRSLIFDIFPRGLASGYFHDVTRTWCIGYAPDEIQAVYDDVQTIFRRVLDTLKVGEDSQRYEIMTLDYFEAKGHPTTRSHPGTFDGYVHSLGHGLGLNIHEAPSFSRNRRSSVLAPGMVFTVEPGLYYPERGFGVRIEDTVYFDQTGHLRTLTDVPYDLVLPLRG